jgi:histidinol-phosphate aminotransferase
VSAPETTLPSMLDLSMNETPYPPLPGIARLVVDGAQRLNRYPDHSAGRLITTLAGRLAVSPEQVAVGPGSAGLCQHILQALGPQRTEVVHAALSFEAYPLLIANAGGQPVAVPMAGYRCDLPAMAAAVNERTRCILVCSPNNPTGAPVHRAELAELIQRVPADVTIVVDEAYREFVQDPDAADGLEAARRHPNVCVLRTFSKAYGLAALRVGYAVGAPGLIRAAHMLSMVFFPSGPGQLAAAASLDPAIQAELAQRCAELAGERDRLGQRLRAAGLPVAPSEANFLWLAVGERAAGFAEACREAGVLVRAYPGHGVRVTVATRPENERFLALAAEIWRAGS